MEKTRQFNNDQEYREKQNCTEEILRDKLADLTQEMNQFTYIVSHDLQAPLRMVTGFLELLEKKYGNKLDESGKQYIEFAVKGAVKMKNLVMDLLEYSRLSSDIKPFTQVDLNEIVEEVTKELLPVIEETGAIVTTCELPVVMARKTQMVQLFHHLLDNALKFRNTGVPEIDLTLKRRNNFWEIAVKDNGEGIDPAFSDKIFIIFRRLNNDEKKYPGTGTGLALCKKIVELHGGAIEISSAVGKGSTFSFTLPAAP